MIDFPTLREARDKERIDKMLLPILDNKTNKRMREEISVLTKELIADIRKENEKELEICRLVIQNLKLENENNKLKQKLHLKTINKTDSPLERQLLLKLFKMLNYVLMRLWI